LSSKKQVFIKRLACPVKNKFLNVGGAFKLHLILRKEGLWIFM